MPIPRRKIVRKVVGPESVVFDGGGKPIIDPTANVIALSEAATQRQDDLREMNNVRIDAEIHRLDSNTQHVKETAELRAAHVKEIADLHAANVKILSDIRAEHIKEMAKPISQTLITMTERIAALEKSSYEGKGKQTMADPMFSELVSEMKKVSSHNSDLSGKSEGLKAMWGYVLGAVGLVMAIFSIIAMVTKM